MPPDSLEGRDREEIAQRRMEYDVLAGLRDLGHTVHPLPVRDELLPIRNAISGFRPHVAFNLLMHFHDEGIYDSAVVSWLELRKQRYSGCNPRGLFVAGDPSAASATTMNTSGR